MSQCVLTNGGVGGDSDGLLTVISFVSSFSLHHSASVPHAKAHSGCHHAGFGGVIECQKYSWQLPTGGNVTSSASCEQQTEGESKAISYARGGACHFVADIKEGSFGDDIVNGIGDL